MQAQPMRARMMRAQSMQAPPMPGPTLAWMQAPPTLAPTTRVPLMLERPTLGLPMPVSPMLAPRTQVSPTQAPTRARWMQAPRPRGS